MTYRPVTKIIVSMAIGPSPIRVGTLAMVKRSIYFEYDPSFLESGIEISPFRLPLKAGTFQAKPEPFEGLFGVFNDSLADGWGRLLLDRSLKSLGISAVLASKPAYDLTYSGGPGGEQSTMVMGERKTPGRPHFLQLAEKFGIARAKAAAILDQVAGAVGNW